MVGETDYETRGAETFNAALKHGLGKSMPIRARESRSPGDTEHLYRRQGTRLVPIERQFDRTSNSRS